MGADRRVGSAVRSTGLYTRRLARYTPIERAYVTDLRGLQDVTAFTLGGSHHATIAVPTSGTVHEGGDST